jgi:hypothetical protein
LRQTKLLLEWPCPCFLPAFGVENRTLVSCLVAA